MAITMQTASIPNVTFDGVLRNYSRQVVTVGKFHVYDKNGKFLTYGETTAEGKFSFSLKDLPIEQKIDLIFRLCHEKTTSSSYPTMEDRVARDLYFMNERMEVQETTRSYVVIAPAMNLGEVRMDSEYLTEKVPASYLDDLKKAAIGTSLKATMESIKAHIDIFGFDSVEKVQRSFNTKNIPLTANETWKMILNGICPMYFKSTRSHLIAEVNWDAYEFYKLQSLPNVKLLYKKDFKQDESPQLEQIHVQFRETKDPSKQYGELKIYTPDNFNFEEALRIANSVFMVYGETVYHLSIGHVYGAQVANAAFDYLQGTKLGELILPHCQFIQKISFELGKAAIFGENGILHKSALSLKGIAQLIDDTVASIDPFTFEPRKVMCQDHNFARGQRLHFNIVKDSVKEFIDNNWEAIVKDWPLIHKFFHTIHKKSPFYRPWDGLPLETAQWHDANEMGANENPQVPPRTKFVPSDGEVRSIRWVAKNPAMPEGNDKAMLKAFAAHYIHLVTFWHSWIHRTQYAENTLFPNLLDVNFSPITIADYGKRAFGGIDIQTAISQHRFAEVFAKFDVTKYALVESPKVYPGLIRRIKAAASDYLSLGIDPLKEIAFSTVI